MPPIISTPRLSFVLALASAIGVLSGAGRCCAQKEYLIEQWSHDVEMVKWNAGISWDDRSVSVRESFRYDRPESRSLFPSDDDWYPDTAALLGSGGGGRFVDVGGGLINGTSGWLDPEADLGASSGRIRRGDLIVLYRQQRTDGDGEVVKPLVMIYCGMEPFPDLEGADKQRVEFPFFIYPYYSWMEWNTFPPRQHRHLRLRLLDDAAWYEKLWRWIKNVFTNFSTDPDYGHRYQGDPARGCRWLKTAITENYLGWWHDDELWSKKTGDDARLFRYRVFRLKSDPDFVHLKRYMPNHEQHLDYSSCFFAAYANVATYYGKNPFGRHDRKALLYERQLIEKEVLQPNNDSRRSTSRIFRHGLVNAQEENRTQDDPSKLLPSNRRWWTDSLRNAPGNRLNRDLSRKNNPYLAWWYTFAYGNRYEPIGILTPVPGAWRRGFADKLNQADIVGTPRLWNAMRSRLADDTPIIAALMYEDVIVRDKQPLSRGFELVTFKEPLPQVNALGTMIGHFVVVVGMREQGGRRFVYFIENGSLSYARWVDFVAAVQIASMEGFFFEMPPGWKWNSGGAQKHLVPPIVVADPQKIMRVQ